MKGNDFIKFWYSCCDLLTALLYYYFCKAMFLYTDQAWIFKKIHERFSKRVFIFLLGISSLRFQNNFSARFACEISSDSLGDLSYGFSVHFCSTFQDIVSFGLMWEMDSVQRRNWLHSYRSLNLDWKGYLMHV